MLIDLFIFFISLKYKSDVWSKMAKNILPFLPYLGLLKLLINFIFAVQARWKAGPYSEIGTQNCCSILTSKFYMSQNTSKKTKITTTFVGINNSGFVI